MDNYYESIYDRFKFYTRINDYEVDRWEPRLMNEIVVYLRNGDAILYDDINRTHRCLMEYERDEYGDYIMDNDAYKKAFSVKLRRLMTSRRMSQRMLSDATGIHIGALSHYMNGRNIPDMRNALKLSRALDCDVEELNNFE